MTRFNQVVVDKTASLVEVGAGLGNPPACVDVCPGSHTPIIVGALSSRLLPARVLHQAALQLCRARTANDRITICPDLVTLLSSHKVRAYKAARDKLARPPCRTRATPGLGVQGCQGQARKATVSHTSNARAIKTQVFAAVMKYDELVGFGGGMISHNVLWNSVEWKSFLDGGLVMLLPVPVILMDTIVAR
ncbi:hypothetical protein BGY98DRAFT_939913 [Russula aff. rugulosa BPL654]|nr:hypothetical protein BGY98DRAFT_939913 [Russula aff. rugulosa BPL654]